jgi:hypothetical protein
VPDIHLEGFIAVPKKRVSVAWIGIGQSKMALFDLTRKDSNYEMTYHFTYRFHFKRETRSVSAFNISGAIAIDVSTTDTVIYNSSIKHPGKQVNSRLFRTVDFCGIILNNSNLKGPVAWLLCFVMKETYENL